MATESAQRDLWTIDPSAPDPSKTIVAATNDAAVDWNPVWSPNGQHLYFGSDRNGTMNLWRVRIDEKSGKTHGEPEPVTTPARFSAHYSLSRDGTRMVFAAIDQSEEMRTLRFDPGAGAVAGDERVVLNGSFLVFSSQVSPDGRFVAVTNRGGQEDLFVIEIATGEVRQLTNDAARDRGAVWSPDGSKIYFYSQRDASRYEIWSINADGSGLTRITRTTGRSVWYPAVSANGKHLSFYNDEHSFTLDLSQPSAKIEQLPPAGEGLHPAMMAWSPDATMLAGELRPRPGLAIYNVAERTYRLLTSTGARPIFLPNHREILFSDSGNLRIVDVKSGAIRDVGFRAGAMSLSADGKTLVYSERQTQSDIWMLEFVGPAAGRP